MDVVDAYMAEWGHIVMAEKRQHAAAGLISPPKTDTPPCTSKQLYTVKWRNKLDHHVQSLGTGYSLYLRPDNHNCNLQLGISSLTREEGISLSRCQQLFRVEETQHNLNITNPSTPLPLGNRNLCIHFCNLACAWESAKCFTISAQRMYAASPRPLDEDTNLTTNLENSYSLYFRPEKHKCKFTIRN